MQLKMMEVIGMKAMQAVRDIMEKQGVRPSVLCGRLNIGSNVLANRMKQENVSVDKLNEMLRVMDYKIVLMPKSARVSAGEYELE